MWSRAKAFVSRNKYRLLGSAAVVGGVVYYYRDTLRQAYQLYRLVQDLQTQETEEAPKTQISAGLVKTLAAADEASQKQMQAIRTHVTELYGLELERVKTELKTGSENDREEVFRHLFWLCFARMVTTLWALHAVWLLGRVSVCLIARDEKSGDREDHRELLSLLRVVGSRDSLASADACIRRAVDRELREANLGPTCVTSRTKMEPVLSKIMAKVLGELRESEFCNLLLGPVNSENRVIEQCLDVIESPQFLAILGFSLDRAILKALLRSQPTDKKDEFPAALLLPGIRTEPDVATGMNSVYFQLFKEVPGLDEFCESVYEAEAQTANDSEQLGALLEKLVQTDVKRKASIAE